MFLLTVTFLPIETLEENMSTMVKTPNKEGYFGEYGGSFLPPDLQPVMDEITKTYKEISQSPGFQEELTALYQDYVGRPSP